LIELMIEQIELNDCDYIPMRSNEVSSERCSMT
jgi:hypothetical protein